MPQKQQTRSRTSRSSSVKPAPTKRPTAAGSPSEAVEYADRSLQASLRGLATVAGDGDRGLVLGGDAMQVAAQVAQSDVTDELAKGGPAFGTFVDSVGQAVAKAQTALDKTLVSTAESLSQTEINVIAIYEQQLKDEDGTMDKGNVVMQKLPLINYLMPTAYQWSRVFLQADMNVSEFNSANGFNIQSKSTSQAARASASYGLFGGFGASGGVSYNTSSYATSGGATYAQDYAAGTLHLEATLEPRVDVQTPKPLILQKGPTLKVTLDSRNEIDKDGNPTTDPAKVVARRIVLTATLLDKEGKNNTGKTLAVSVDKPLLDYVTDPADSKTDASGQLKVTITHRATPQELATAVQAIVSIRFGLVVQPISISI